MSESSISAEIDLATPIDTDYLIAVGAGAAITIPVAFWALFAGLESDRASGAFQLISAVFLGVAGVVMLLGALRHCAAELVAEPEGVRIGMLVTVRYAWCDIAGFEIGEPPWAGRDAPGVMLLHDGHRVTLHALRETRSSLDPSTRPDVVDKGVRTLNRLLEQARAAPR